MIDRTTEFACEAAATGLFDPRPLIDGASADPSRIGDLDALARESEEVNDGGRIVWRLLPEARRRVLGSVDAAQWREIAARVDPLPSDGFGQALQSLLGGTMPDVGATPPEALDDLHEALLFADPVLGGQAAPLLRELRSRIARKEAENAQSTARSGAELFGRDDDLATLENFAATGSLRAPYAFGPGAPRWLILLTGMGGLGKSALIAGLSTALRGPDWHGRPVVLLDFDRAALRSVDLLELTREFSRQLATARPQQLEAPMEALRRTMGKIANEIGARERSSQLGALSIILPQLGQIYGDAGIEPPVMVLDTFEEIGVLVPEAQDAVLDWIASLRNHAGFGEMPVIVSARVPPELGRKLESVFGGHLPLDGLDPKSGAALLRSRVKNRRFSGERGLRASTALGGHPLALIMLARYAQTASATDVDAVTTEGGTEGKFNAEFAQSFLYTRILGRIVSGDPRVAKVASPGLALRRVTPALIEHVLAEPCGLDLGDDPMQQAHAIFDQLVRNYWLVERDPAEPGVVRHRRDLRRYMLPQIMASEVRDDRRLTMRERALAVHRAAHAWYASERDETLAPTLQAVEAFYHRCFLPDVVIGDADHRIASQLGQDAAELPLAARALVKFTAGQVLDAAEIKALPLQSRLIARSRLEAVASRVGAAQQVIEQTQIRRAEEAAVPKRFGRLTINELERSVGREMLALFSRGNYASASRLATETYWAELPGMLDRGWDQADTTFRGSLLFSGFWTASLCSLLDFVPACDDSRLGRAFNAVAVSRSKIDGFDLELLTAVAMLFALSTDRRTRDSAMSVLERMPDVPDPLAFRLRWKSDRKSPSTLLPELYPPVLFLLGGMGGRLPPKIVELIWHRDPKFSADVPEPDGLGRDEVDTRLLIETIDRHRLLEPCLREFHAQTSHQEFLTTADLIHQYETRLGWPAARSVGDDPNISMEPLMPDITIDLAARPVLRSMRRLGSVPRSLAESAELEAVRRPKVSPPERFAGLTGYAADFLSFDVPLPVPTGERARDVLAVPGNESGRLDYLHFSLVMSVSRRVAVFTAVNIDGAAAKSIARHSPDVWFLDGRIAADAQIGPELYADNILDKGHLVRREDPNWGDPAVAAAANDLTFHYTNCSPQTAHLNEQTWVGLENYILQNAKVWKDRVTVFTGPVFGAADLRYRGVSIPNAFWKVIAFVGDDGKPSATAYLVDQVEELKQLEAAFGVYRTYQRSIHAIEAMTGLEFGSLRQFDGFSNEEQTSGVSIRALLTNPADVRV